MVKACKSTSRCPQPQEDSDTSPSSSNKRPRDKLDNTSGDDDDSYKKRKTTSTSSPVIDLCSDDDDDYLSPKDAQDSITKEHQDDCIPFVTKKAAKIVRNNHEEDSSNPSQSSHDNEKEDNMKERFAALKQRLGRSVKLSDIHNIDPALGVLLGKTNGM